MRETVRGARRTGFGAGLRRGVAVVLAVAALACWLGKPWANPSAPAVDARGAALTEQSPTARPVGSEPVTGPSGEAYYARAIETIQTGQRVLARNPELAGEELPDAAVDPATWVNIRLRMAKPSGEFLEFTLLRPVEWLAGHLAQATALDGEYPRALVEARTNLASGIPNVTSVIPADGSGENSPGGIDPVTVQGPSNRPWIFLTLHELEAVGPAEIVEVGPCPEVETGEGRLVAGMFSHQSGEVFDITVDGLTAPIGCTGAHPFWSEDRHAFIPARDLRPGETLRSESGTLRQITRITPRRGPPVAVFNLEVDAEHVYYVSVDGVLVHNACPANVVELEVGTFGDLARRSARDGLTPEHIPSFASVKANVERQLGRQLTAAEEAALRNQTNGIVVPTRSHMDFSRTYGGRNTPQKILEDSLDQQRAFQLDLQSWRQHLLDQGHLPEAIDHAFRLLDDLNRQAGRY